MFVDKEFVEEKWLFSTNLGVGRPGDTPRALK